MTAMACARMSAISPLIQFHNVIKYFCCNQNGKIAQHSIFNLLNLLRHQLMTMTYCPSHKIVQFIHTLAHIRTKRCSCLCFSLFVDAARRTQFYFVFVSNYCETSTTRCIFFVDEKFSSQRLWNESLWQRLLIVSKMK
jgi:hypothetical protein